VEGRLAAYAREADPTLLAEKEWRAFKEATFGPEDGVDFISAASLREAHIPRATSDPSWSPAVPLWWRSRPLNSPF
jgi:hypothetical protein